MRPVLFELGGVAFETDGVLYFIAAVLAAIYAGRVFRRRDWNPDDVLPGVVLAVVATLLGAWMHGAILAATVDGGSAPRSVGLSFYGGLVLGTVAILGYLRWKRYPIGEVADALTPIAPVLYAIFRLGCLLNGDDYGTPTDLPWGMAFPQGSPPTSEQVHPTQIYEIMLMIPLFAWLWWRANARMPPGALTFDLAIGMGLERFVVEFWRVGIPGPVGLTVAQWLSLALVGVGVVGRWVVERRRQSASSPTSPTG